MLPFQVDSPFGEPKFREGCCHFNLTHPFVGNAGVKFREGCCPPKLTHPLVSHLREEFREGSDHSKLTHPLGSHSRVTFREGCCQFNLTHPFVSQEFREGSCLTHLFVGNAGVKCLKRKLPIQLDSPFGELLCHSNLEGNAGVKFREGSGHAKLTQCKVDSPFGEQPEVKCREGSGHSNLTHSGQCRGKILRRKLPFQFGSPFGEPPEGKI